MIRALKFTFAALGAAAAMVACWLALNTPLTSREIETATMIVAVSGALLAVLLLCRGASIITRR